MEEIGIATPIVPIRPATPVLGTATSGGGINWSFITGNVIPIVAVIGVIFGIALFFYFIRKSQKPDPFMQDFKVKKSQCKMFRKSGVKNVYIENSKDGLVRMGDYEGECIDKEGFKDIMFSRLRFGVIGGFIKKVTFWMFPLMDLLLKKYWIVRCNVNPIYVPAKTRIAPKPASPSPTGAPIPAPVAGVNVPVAVPVKDEHEGEILLPVPYITRGTDAVIIHCLGLQLKKYYTYPILLGSEGSIIQDEAVNFTRERDSILNDTLYQQTIDFSNAMREAVNMNPSLRYVIKTEGKTLPDTSGGQA